MGNLKNGCERLRPGVVGLAMLAMLPACGGPPTQVKDKLTPPPPPKVEKVKGIPESAVAAFNEGLADLAKKPADYRAAAVAFEKATSIHGDYVVAWVNRGLSYEKLGRHADAATAYRTVIKKGANDRGLTMALGRALLLSGEIESAILEFESVLRKHPDDLEARNNLAAAYQGKGDWNASLRYVKEVLAVQPKNVPAIVNLGLIYLQQKKLPLALLMFTKAIGYEKNNPQAHNNLGLAYYQLDNVPGAVSEFAKAIEFDDTMDEARLNLGSIYLDYLDYAAALDQFEAVRKRFPKHYEAMVGAADCLYGTGEYDKAVALFEESLQMRANNGEVLLRTGKIYEEQLGKPTQALSYYKRYVEVANPPANDPIRQNIMFLEQAKQMEQQTTTTADPQEAAPPANDGDKAPTPTPAEGEGAPSETAPTGDGQTAPSAEADGTKAPPSADPAPTPETTEGAAPAKADPPKPKSGEGADGEG